MTTTSSNHVLFGIPWLHVEHVLMGAAIAVVFGVPAFFIYLKRSKKQVVKTLDSQVQDTKHEAKSERIKSDIILSGIEDGVVVVGQDKVIQLFNPGAANISGWPVEEAEKLAYTSVFQLLDNKNKPYAADQDPFAQAFVKKTVVRDHDAYLLTKSKKQVPIQLSVSPLIDSDGQIDAVVGVFRDVAKERQQEQQRAEFISTASHEMRTPVAAIEGYLALALNSKVANIDAKARSYLEKAHSSTQHLGQLFQDLLTSAKAEDGRLVSHPRVVELGDLLQQITDSLRFSADAKQLKCEFVIGANSVNATNTTVAGTKVIQPLYYVYADPDRLREVITNLFDNAVKYTEAGKITIGITGDDKVVQLFVQDTGGGIPPEDVPHLFQKFYRVDNSATRTIGGTGLGLFISRKIIELYDGRIWVESEQGKGSTFYINLPRLDTLKATELQKQITDPSVISANPIQTP